jgi:hypothetical protein
MLIMLIPSSTWTIWQPFQKQHASDVVNRRKRDDIFTCAHGIVALVVLSNNDITLPCGIDALFMVLSNECVTACSSLGNVLGENLACFSQRFCCEKLDLRFAAEAHQTFCLTLFWKLHLTFSWTALSVSFFRNTLRSDFGHRRGVLLRCHVLASQSR